jgi:hypothetical protein
MSNPPAFFNETQREARELWEQLEANPKLAGPWWQLFKQVKSIRHVISELLQNAEDAGATAVSMSLQNENFVFTHNGEAFNSETFQSLCQFGFSNKRHLHTIGFRGIGFKSVFSIGPDVNVFSPGLSFCFNESRFTEPQWIRNGQTNGETIFSVRVDSPEKIEQLDLEMQNWGSSPFPLLFFNSIKKLTINQQVIRKDLIGPGPVQNSKYMCLKSENDIDVLVITSDSEKLPDNALEEIAEERGLTDDTGIKAFSESEVVVQLVLSTDMETRLFTVLPTGIFPKVAFSCNAPFIQDPSRKEIKEPSNSPTNQWLLTRIGSLAHDSMMEWLENESMDMPTRARAYQLFILPVASSQTLSQACTWWMQKGFGKNFDADRPFLLGCDGRLHRANKVVSLPDEILDTWEPDAALNIFAPEKKGVLSREVSADTLSIMHEHGFVESFNNKTIARRLLDAEESTIIRPLSLINLVNLYAYLHYSLRYEWSLRNECEKLPVVPAEGYDYLLPARELLNPPKTISALDNSDWDFLLAWIDVVDPSWLKLMAECKSRIQEKESLNDEEAKYHKAIQTFDKIHLTSRSSLQDIFSKAAKEIIEVDDCGAECIRLAHIAAKANLSVPNDFYYLCQNGKWESISILPLNGLCSSLPKLLPQNYFDQYVISDDYRQDLQGLEIDKWNKWIADPSKSRLHHFLLPGKKIVKLIGTEMVIQTCRERSCPEPKRYPLQSREFELEDFFWPEELWQIWQEKALEEENFWTHIGKAVVRGYSKTWKDIEEAKICQLGTVKKHLVAENLEAEWLHRLKSMPCLPDEYNNPHTSAELLRATPATMPLQNIESFIHPDLDKPEYDEILELLGVRNQPESYDKLLERLSILSRTSTVPSSKITDLFRALDRVVHRMPPEDVENLRHRFLSDPLVYTSENSWASLQYTFLDNPDQVPIVKTVHPNLNHLDLWRKLKIANHPTIDIVIDWIKGLSPGQAIDKKDKHGIRLVLRRKPEIVWEEIGCWLDATGKWTFVTDLKYALTDAASSTNLFASVKKQTADFSMLSEEIDAYCSSWNVERLDAVIEYRPEYTSYRNTGASPDWIRALGSFIAKIIRPANMSEETQVDDAALEEDRKTGNVLAKSTWQSAEVLNVVPYIGNNAVGLKTSRKVVWSGNRILAVGQLPYHFQDLAAELKRYFHLSEIKEAVTSCIDRPGDWIKEYFQANFQLPEDQEPESARQVATNEAYPRQNGPVFPEEVTDIVFGKAPDTNSVSENSRNGDPAINPETEDPPREKASSTKPDSEKQPKLTKKLLLGSILYKKGYEWSELKGAFKGPNGAFVAKDGGLFPWTEYDQGQVIARYWPTLDIIENHILVPAELWNWDNTEDSLYLVCQNQHGKALCYSLKDLKSEQIRDEIEIYPASYRLCLKSQY